jgi:tetratricopeptide (TPR) repeat protein
VSVQLTSLVALALVALLGRADPTPALNTQALSLAANSNSSDQAIALLRESLALNPDQEIAHFNLGWLLVVRDPAAAERHFLQAAHLVPDKGGVYFGLALARLNRGNRNADASDALALECLNDPLFLTSPWWREPAIAALRTSALSRFVELAERVASELDQHSDNRARDARYIVALAAWLEGRGALGEILARSQTSERVSYFAARPHVPEFNEAPVRSYRRVRSGYPVLMRKLDLTPPVDLFDVRETILFADELSFLFPAKGWLPSPLLVQLLDQSTRRK